MREIEDLELLQSAIKVLMEIASFYVSEHKVAVRARRKAQRHLLGKIGQQAFHATLLSRLTSLHSILRPNVESPSLSAQPNAITNLLRTFEELTGDEDDTVPEIEYPGVHRLVEQYEDDRHNTGPRPIGYRICLFAPSLRLQNQLNSELTICHDVLSANTAYHEARRTPSFLADIEDIKEWRPRVDITRTAERLHQVLLRHLECPRGHQHDELKVCSLPALQAEPGKTYYTLCLQTDATQDEQWSPVRLEFTHPEESSFGFQKTSTKVRWRDDPLSPRNGSRVGEEETVTPASICGFLDDDGKGGTLRASLTELVRDSSGTEKARTARVQMKSMQNCLSDGSLSYSLQVDRKRRVELGVTLAYIYLHLCETAWWPRDNIRPGFWLAHQAGTDDLLGRQPFMEVRKMTAEGELIYGFERLINAERPSLPALGKLLLEIWKGAAVEWKDLQATMDQCNQDWIGEYWMCAVNECLGQDLALKQKGGLRTSSSLRSVFVHRVIKSLQWLLEKLCHLSVDDLMEPQLSAYIAVTGKRADAASAVLDDVPACPAPLSHLKISRQRTRPGPRWLIDVQSLKLEYFPADHAQTPEYAILSHRWSMDEIAFTDWSSSAKEDKSAWTKIKGACRQAQQDCVPYIWVDTCCIDRRSSAELDEAINSMFGYYEDAKICYVHLSDVPGTCPLRDEHQPFTTGSPQHRVFIAMQQSQWFTRGWTLQELVAPTKVKFFGVGWKLLGSLDQMATIVSYICQIDVAVLRHEKAIGTYSYAQRLSWAARRQTTRPEDEAYCLLGILGVHLPVKYGVGQKAFYDLQRKLLESGSGDDSMLAWTPRHRDWESSLFATSPADFLDAGDIVCLKPRPMDSHFYFRSDGMAARVWLHEYNDPSHGWAGTVALLNCAKSKDRHRFLGLCLQVAPELTAEHRSLTQTLHIIRTGSMNDHVFVNCQHLRTAAQKDVTFAVSRLAIDQ